MSGDILQFPLMLGLNEDANPKAAPTSSLKTGANIRWPKQGQIGKRWGSELLSRGLQGGGNISGIRRFVVRGAELSVTDGKQLYPREPERNQWLVANVGRRISEPSLEWETILDDHRGVRSCDVAVWNRWAVFAWVTGDPTKTNGSANEATFMRIRNIDTGADVFPPQLIATFGGQNIRVLVINDFAFVLFSNSLADNPTPGDIVYWSIDLGTLNVATNGLNAISADVKPHGAFDAIALASGDVMIAYENDAADLATVRFDNSGSGVLTSIATSTVSGETRANFTAVAISEDTSSNKVYLAYRANTGGNAFVRVASVYNANMAPADAPAGVIGAFDATQVTCEVIAPGTVLIAFSGHKDATAIGVDGTDPTRTYSLIANATGAVIANTRRHSPGIELVSRSFKLSDRSYVFACDAPITTTTPTPAHRFREDRQLPSISSYLVEIETVARAGASNSAHFYGGKVDHDIASVISPGMLPKVIAIDDDLTLIAPVPFQAEPATEHTNWRAGIHLVSITVDPTRQADPYKALTIGHEAYISGALEQAWDGRSVFDLGMRSPAVLAVNSDFLSVGDAEPGLANGTYLYQFTSSYRSHAGRLHRGPVTPGVSVPVARSNNSANVGFGLLTHSLDDKQPAHPDGMQGQFSPGIVLVEVYRSEADGSVPQKLTYEPKYNMIINDPADNLGLDGYMLFFDVANDDDITHGGEAHPVSIQTRAPIYIDAELEAVQPPAQYTHELIQNRIWLISGSRQEIWYSKDTSEDLTLAPEFHPDLRLTTAEILTAIGNLDQRPIVFWERGIWFVDGDGPNSQGDGNTYKLNRLQTDIGCTNSRSLVGMPQGLMFECNGEIFLLDRGLQIQTFGRPVIDTLAAHPTITSAVLVADENEVRFTCNSDTAGIVLVFDYLRNVWFTRSYPGAEPIVDATLHNGSYYMASSSNVRREVTSTHLDDATVYVPSNVVFTPIAPSGPAAWHRVRRAFVMGSSLSNHSLSIAIARDFSNTVTQTKPFAAGSDVTTPGPYERAMLDLAVQKVQAVEIHISDSAPSNTTTHPLGNGGGFTLDGVALLVQPKRGLPRLNANRRG